METGHASPYRLRTTALVNLAAVLERCDEQVSEAHLFGALRLPRTLPLTHTPSAAASLQLFTLLDRTADAACGVPLDWCKLERHPHAARVHHSE